MYNLIVGTAGHVDHGKTCLIKALTGVDTDRLKDEKKRGITIELGFAEMTNDKNLNIGFIDVPGHEKFIKNMLAGIGGIDLVLLVIAADEGMMPQSVEHLEILRMLHINQGIVVITKVDLVDEEWLEIVRDDISQNVAGTFLEQAPIVEVSAYTGQNIVELKELIYSMAEKSEKRRIEPELLRIPVDRVFTIDGFGTVITGTLLEGAIAVGDEVEIYPKGKLAKVRNLQVHGHMVKKAYAGQRTAVNLAGIKKEELQRGNVLAAPSALLPTKLLDVKIALFKDSPRTLKNGSRLHLYSGSSEVLCKAVLLGADLLESGQSGYAQLRLEEDIAVRKGDRFILRFYSPVESIGGGVILDSNPPRRKRFKEETLSSLSVKENGSEEELLEQVLLEESMKMLNISEIGRKLGWTGEEILEKVNFLVQKGKAVIIAENLAIHRNYWDFVKEKATELLGLFHKDNPVRPGMPKEEFRKRVGEILFLKNSLHVEILVDRMIYDKIIADSGNIISLPDFCITYTPQMQALKDKIEAEYRKRGSESPETAELLMLFKENERMMVTELLEALRREGRLKKLTGDCYIHTACLEKAVLLLKEFVNKKGSITLSEYRDLLGTSRKYAVRILEYLDQQKVTKMVDEARILNE